MKKDNIITNEKKMEEKIKWNKLLADLKEKGRNIITGIPYFLVIMALSTALYFVYRFLPKGDKFLSLIFGSGLTGAAAIIGIFYKQASKEKAQIENTPHEGLPKVKKESFPSKEQIEEEFLKVNAGDFQDITDEVDKSLREKNISILSYVKNPLLQLKQECINEDFSEPWLPNVPADMGKREKKPYYQITPLYQGVILPFSYFFVSMDGFRYMVPLPNVEYNRIENFKIDRNNPIKKCTVTQAQYQLGKALTNDSGYNTSYDNILKQCRIEVVR